MHLEFSAPLITQHSSIDWNNIVQIPLEFHEEIRNQDHLRVKCVFNANDISVTAHISIKKRRDELYLVLNAAQRKKIKVSEGDTIHLTLDLETSPYGMPMPEEFLLMMQEDERADKLFHNLTPGKQRSLIYTVSKLKNVDARIRKALAICEHLVEYNGELDYKALNDKVKEVNQRHKA